MAHNSAMWLCCFAKQRCHRTARIAPCGLAFVQDNGATERCPTASPRPGWLLACLLACLLGFLLCMPCRMATWPPARLPAFLHCCPPNGAKPAAIRLPDGAKPAAIRLACLTGPSRLQYDCLRGPSRLQYDLTPSMSSTGPH